MRGEQQLQGWAAEQRRPNVDLRERRRAAVRSILHRTWTIRQHDGPNHLGVRPKSDDDVFDPRPPGGNGGRGAEAGSGTAAAPGEGEVRHATEEMACM